MYTVGSILSVQRSLYQHVGAYLGNGLVLQNSRPRGEEIVTIQKFSEGTSFTVKDPGPICEFSFLDRAYAIANNPRRYSFLSNNCEHTVTKALYGVARSPTIQFASIVMALGVLIAMAARSR